MKSILFICSANQCRSPFCEHYFLSLVRKNGLEPHWRVESAGVWQKTAPRTSPSCVRLAASFGVDLHGHKPRTIDALESLNAFDWIIVMERNQREVLFLEFPEIEEKVFLLTGLAGKDEGDIPDPMGAQTQHAYDIYVEMMEMVDAIFKRLVVSQTP